jgi:chromosome partitioning protein
VGRKVDVDDLVGTSEIAERLGVSRHQVVHDWRRRHRDFPQPVAQLKRGPIWSWRDVERWARATGRLRPQGG